MDKFILNVSHRPELVPEYINTDAVEGKADDLGAGGQGVTDHREPVEAQPAVEQVGLHPLSHQRGLADRHIAHQPRVGQLPGPTEHGAG